MHEVAILADIRVAGRIGPLQRPIGSGRIRQLQIGNLIAENNGAGWVIEIFSQHPIKTTLFLF